MSLCRLLGLSLLSFLFISCQNSVNYKEFQKKRIVFLGDSITNNGLYVSYIEYHLFMKNIDADVISVGLSSETASGLSEKEHPFPRPCIHTRIDKVLSVIKPDIVVACYGMNDGIYNPQSRSRMLAYEIGVKQLINKVERSGAQMILMTPPPFDPKPIAHKTKEKSYKKLSYKNPYIGYNDVLKDYAKWLKSLDYPVVDQNTSLSNFLVTQRKVNSSFQFSKDGIHPNSAGHLLMAYNFLDAVGLSVNEADLVQHEKELSIDPIFELVHKRRKMRSKGWLEYVGYSRGKDVKADSVEEVEKTTEELKKTIQEEVIKFKMPVL